MKVLVTGATGFSGNHWRTRSLLAAIQVRALVRPGDRGTPARGARYRSLRRPADDRDRRASTQREGCGAHLPLGGGVPQRRATRTSTTGKSTSAEH